MNNLKLGTFAGRAGLVISVIALVASGFAKCSRDHDRAMGVADSAIVAYMNYANAGKEHGTLHFAGSRMPSTDEIYGKFAKVRTANKDTVEFTLDSVEYKAYRAMNSKVENVRGTKSKWIEIAARMPSGSTIIMESAPIGSGGDGLESVSASSKFYFQGELTATATRNAGKNALFLKLWVKLDEELGKQEDARHRKIDKLQQELKKIAPDYRYHERKADSLKERMWKIDREVKDLKRTSMDRTLERMAFPARSQAAKRQEIACLPRRLIHA